MTRYTKTMTEALQEVREGLDEKFQSRGYTTKQVKMAIGIANDPRYKGGNYSGAVRTIEKIKKGLADHPQVAAVLKRLNTDYDPEVKEMCSCDCDCKESICESCGKPKDVKESSKAKRDAMRAMGKRGIDPADVDDVATDADQKSAGKNMVTQLRKAMDTRGNFSLEFQDGKKQKVDSKIVDTLLKAYDMIRKPRDKEKFVAMISKSYRDMLNTTKMVSKQLRMGEEVELDEKYDLYHKTFSAAMQHAYDYAKKKLGIEIDSDEIDDKVAMGPRKPSSGKTNKYRLMGMDKKGKSKGVQIQVANLDNKRYELNMYKEEVEITDALVEGMKMNDPKLLRVFDKLKKGSTVKIKHDSTLEKGKDFIEYIVKSKNMVRRGTVEKITMARKDSPTSAKRYLYKRDGKVTMAFGDMAVSPVDIKEEETKQPVQWPSQPLPEQEEPKKPDSAKEVEQGRDDKKKTRIAQLQLQIAKAQETINKINAQEK